MSFFSPRQRRTVVDQFWSHGVARCPDDHAELDSQFHVHAAGYLLVFACGHCGKKAQVTRYSDPQSREFRPWKVQEAEGLAAAHFAGARAECPVCQAKVQSRRGAGNSFLTLECLRCGNFHPFVPVPSADELLATPA